MAVLRIASGLYTCTICQERIYSPVHPADCPVCKRGRGSRGLTVRQPQACPWAPIVTRLTPEGLAGLDRCRRAGCRHLRQIEGRIVCDKRGSSCEWIDLWAAWLNGERGCRE